VRLVRARASGQERLFFYVDGPLDGVDDGSLDTIFPWERYADGRPLFLFGDYTGLPSSWQNQTVFKQSCPKSSPALPFFYVVYIDMEPRPILECDFKVGFHGCSRTHDCRPKLRAILDRVAPCYYCDNNQSWWGFSPDQQRFFRVSYLRLLENTKFILCPRGKGLNSIRFFESLRLGRIPVFLSDDAKLPLENIIDYNQFIVRVPEADAERADEYIQAWSSSHDLVQASARASQVSRQYFQDPEEFVRVSLGN
jgi:hypothetical protein